MSDPRESGCLTADTRVLRADTAGDDARHSVCRALATSRLGLGRHLALRPPADDTRLPDGVRPVFRPTLESGQGDSRHRQPPLSSRMPGGHLWVSCAPARGWRFPARAGPGVLRALGGPAGHPAGAGAERDPAYTVDRKHANVIGDHGSTAPRGVVDEAAQAQAAQGAVPRASRRSRCSSRTCGRWPGSASVAKSGDRGRIRMESPSRRLVEDGRRCCLGISTRLTETEPMGVGRGRHTAGGVRRGPAAALPAGDRVARGVAQGGQAAARDRSRRRGGGRGDRRAAAGRRRRCGG